MNKKGWRREKKFEKLTESGKRSKMLLMRLCDYLSRALNGRFWLEIYTDNTYKEAWLYGKIDEELIDWEIASMNGLSRSEIENGKLDFSFFGGHFSTKKDRDAESSAWESLLYDCIGMCSDEDIRDIHNIEHCMRVIGVTNIRPTFCSIDELEEFLEKEKV